MIIHIQAELSQPPKKLLNKQSRLKPPPQLPLPQNSKKNAIIMIIQVQLSSKNLKSSMILPPIFKNLIYNIPLQSRQTTPSIIIRQPHSPKQQIRIRAKMIRGNQDEQLK